MFSWKTLPVALLCSYAGGVPSVGLAQTPDQFFKGKTLNLLIPTSQGGEYDTQARLVSRHISRSLPGGPLVIAQNMPGAGGVVMANHFYNLAPRDGTTFGIVYNGLPTVQALGVQKVQFNVGEFNWLGAISPTVETMAFWGTSGIRRVEDARGRDDVVVGSAGTSGITYSFPMLLNEFAGTRMRVVTGYKGGNEINLAMERGEIMGRSNTLSSWRTTRPEWLANNDIVIVAYAGPRPKGFEKIPSLEDFAKSEDDRALIRLVASAGSRLGRPFATPPGVPGPRVEAFRAAFAAVMADPEFLKEAEKLRVEVDPVSGLELERVVTEVLATPDRVRERGKPFFK
ncbi:MAG: tripartite tricarboxylate transporter substrate-binding protein [Beijerinckiaceae bacterium]|nr:tripartite tricarboxylate transporter substrate-binding protein [Beijerinckiaceae bacterium]